MSDDLNYDFQFKILFLGESQVGKTSIILRYTENKFESNSLSTLGMDLVYKYVKMDNLKIRLDLWDTAGEERFKNITKNYFKGANGIIFVYSLAKLETLTRLKNWIEDVEENLSLNDLEMVVAGNKSDLEEERDISKEIVENFLQKYNLKNFEVSAKKGEGINEIFDFLVKKLLSKIKKDTQSESEPISRNNSVVLMPSSPRDKNNPNCQC